MERSQNKRSRSRSRSPPPWRRETNSPRYDREEGRARNRGFSGRGHGRGRGHFSNQYQRRNQEQEDRHMREWMSQEDDFVLKQSKKKARIRVKDGRAKLIDKLVLILSIVDPAYDPLEDEMDDIEIDVKDPAELIEESSLSLLQELEKEVEHYLVLEHNEANRTFWEAIKSVCKYKRQVLSSSIPGRGIGVVSTDVDQLLGDKTLEQLQTLESQVHQKLRSDEAIDEEYWEQLLESIALYKAKAHLKHFFDSVNQARLNAFRLKQVEIARLRGASIDQYSDLDAATSQRISTAYNVEYDPYPQLKLRPEDHELDILEEHEFKDRVVRARMKVSQAGYTAGSALRSKPAVAHQSRSLPDVSITLEDHSSVTNAMYDREAAKGVEEDEEVFAGEEEVIEESKALWSGKYRPRKPKHFNRVQMGYEWNKYNQTHYDHDNPPPKVVQGYKFNIFYPDLIDKSKAPTYRIERENGRKKGQSLAPAGEEDTCLIRFKSGPPYEDIAFRIVDREWDYSAKRERGFKSSFDKGILQLHFQFKKIYYRK